MCTGVQGPQREAGNTPGPRRSREVRVTLCDEGHGEETPQRITDTGNTDKGARVTGYCAGVSY